MLAGTRHLASSAPFGDANKAPALQSTELRRGLEAAHLAPKVDLGHQSRFKAASLPGFAVAHGLGGRPAFRCRRVDP